MKNIREFFQRTDLVTDNLFHSIKLTLLDEDELIPENILGNNKAKELAIQYNDRSNQVIKVDVNAFQSTKYYTKTLQLKNMDSSQLDLGFLFGFNQLAELTFLNVHFINKSLPNLPLLPKLTSLELNTVKGLDDSTITFPTLSTSGLKTFKFRFSGIHTDASVSRMLDWILLSSAKTLETLIIDSIGITEIPSQIPSFTALEYLDLGNNSISTFKKGVLRFFVPISELRLWKNRIKSIEPGAFQGIYFLCTFSSYICTSLIYAHSPYLIAILCCLSFYILHLTGDFRDAKVRLDQNNLTRFEESVFRPMLEQMGSGTGKIDIEYSIISSSRANMTIFSTLCQQLST